MRGFLWAHISICGEELRTHVSMWFIRSAAESPHNVQHTTWWRGLKRFCLNEHCWARWARAMSNRDVRVSALCLSVTYAWLTVLLAGLLIYSPSFFWCNCNYTQSWVDFPTARYHNCDYMLQRLRLLMQLHWNIFASKDRIIWKSAIKCVLRFCLGN